jgi:hypothetical protein
MFVVQFLTFCTESKKIQVKFKFVQLGFQKSKSDWMKINLS